MFSCQTKLTQVVDYTSWFCTLGNSPFPEYGAGFLRPTFKANVIDSFERQIPSDDVGFQLGHGLSRGGALETCTRSMQ